MDGTELAGWREDGKPRKIYLGSCRKMSRDEALQKAREMKAEALDMAGPELGDYRDREKISAAGFLM